MNGEKIVKQPEELTLRDYFAAKAMQGIIASDTNDTMTAANAAFAAYQCADAMLAERSKP